MGFFDRLFGRTKASDDVGATEEPPRAPGWDLIDEIFGRIYPGQTPRHVAPKISPRHDLRPGRSPVEGTHVFDAGEAWHYVTLGLTDLYEKSDPESEASGIGCELSMRVAKRGEVEPPLWPVVLMGLIAAHVEEGALLAQAVSFRTGPIEGAPRDARLEGAVALLDPEIVPERGPFGTVGIMLLVGLAGAELDAIQNGGSAALIARIASERRAWIT